jgi:hypothetical protein
MTDITWSAISAISTLLGVIIVAATAAFAVLQLREMRTARHVDAVMKGWDWLTNPDMMAARTFLAQQVTPPEDKWTEEAMRAAGQMCRSFTRIAVMTRYNLMPRQIAMDLWAPIIIEAWEQVQPFVAQERKTDPLAWSQFEWFYQQATEHRRKYLKEDLPTARST